MKRRSKDLLIPWRDIWTCDPNLSAVISIPNNNNWPLEEMEFTVQDCELSDQRVPVKDNNRVTVDSSGAAMAWSFRPLFAPWARDLGLEIWVILGSGISHLHRCPCAATPLLEAASPGRPHWQLATWTVQCLRPFWWASVFWAQEGLGGLLPFLRTASYQIINFEDSSSIFCAKLLSFLFSSSAYQIDHGKIYTFDRIIPVQTF